MGKQTMGMALSDVVADLHRNRKTGLLSISVVDSTHLFKMFFREGEIYHITWGSLRDAACLARCDELEFSGFGFIPGLSQNMAGKDIPSSAEIIQYLAMLGKTLRTQGQGAERPQAASSPPGDDRFAALAEQLTAALVRQIGPVGKKVFNKIVEGKWYASSPPNREDYQRLKDLLKDEIDDADDRSAFLKEVNRILP